MLGAMTTTQGGLAPGIVRLPHEIASRIAAGEVVERPTSALKELVENSLDAGARNVEIRVNEALDVGFEVADDGAGMPPSALPLALERHATSKLRTLEDLERLGTLGFRGEALPSIAAVSRLRITSRSAAEREGAALESEGGLAGEIVAAARAPGTTVEVRDLFFNTPARRKFLRSRPGELRAALRLLESCSLAFPEVAFRMLVDGREKLDLPRAASRRERMAELLGSRAADQLLEVEATRGDYHLYALLGLPEHARATREGQVLLVNRRWIQSPFLSHALRQAYGNLLPGGRFPAATLWIDVPSERLDVNVHPTKREVRFAEESLLFELVSGPCAQRLASLHPPLEVVRAQREDEDPAWGTVARGGAARVGESPPEQGYLPLLAATAGPSASGGFTSLGGRVESAARSEPALWQLHRTYILAPVRGGLVIVDQHAAHERILYEETRARLEGQRGAAQQLLFPVLVDLSREQFDLLLELAPSLRQLGWEVAALGWPTVVIQGTPSGLRHDRPGQLLQDLLDGVADDTGRDAQQDLTERLARSFACHSAVKAGDELTVEEMRTLVDRLFATTLPHGDPHGRPTFVRLDLEELHRRFGRS
jgi:DNA mismatch repair protein MutL